MIARGARFIPGLLLVAGLLLTAACSAHNDTDGASVATPTTASSTAKAGQPGAFSDGKQYVRIASTVKATGPVVLVEVFSYACPHCAEFAPTMDKLRQSLPKDVHVRLMPAIFSPTWEPYARAFYAASQLGVVSQTHDALFQAMQQNYPLNSLDDLADFYARHGVDRQKFMDTAQSAQTDAQITADQGLEKSWGIDATPMLVVGRLQSDAPNAPVVASYRSNDVDSFSELAQLGGWLVKKEAAQAQH